MAALRVARINRVRRSCAQQELGLHPEGSSGSLKMDAHPVATIHPVVHFVPGDFGVHEVERLPVHSLWIFESLQTEQREPHRLQTLCFKYRLRQSLIKLS